MPQETNCSNLLTIALKYWGIKRKIFKFDYTIRQKKGIIDDFILLYLIYYFLMHKGLLEPCKNLKKEIINEREIKNENKKRK